MASDHPVVLNEWEKLVDHINWIRRVPTVDPADCSDCHPRILPASLCVGCTLTEVRRRSTAVLRKVGEL